MEESERIIVLQTFNNSIDANIIKSKLDAYGVPCFLTEEHLTSLINPIISGGIKLHIFERDRSQVLDLLTEDYVQKNEDDDFRKCPICNSKRILTFTDSRLEPAIVVKMLLQLSKRHYCLECEAEFDD
jgi:hypothetical protein